MEWTAKFGHEVKSEVFSTRMVWAVGYFVENAYFVRSGTIAGVTNLKRAAKDVGKDGAFNEARFEMKKEKGVTKLKDAQGWSWLSNPFVGTKEINGLKIMFMLLSNWLRVLGYRRGSTQPFLLHLLRASGWLPTGDQWGRGVAL